MLVIPLSTVGYTRYARVSHSRQWYNYNLSYIERIVQSSHRYDITYKDTFRLLQAAL